MLLQYIAIKKVILLNKSLDLWECSKLIESAENIIRTKEVLNILIYVLFEKTAKNVKNIDTRTSLIFDSLILFSKKLFNEI